MPNLFILDIETHPDEKQATLRLRDQRGEHLAAQQVKVGSDHAFEWVGLFNTRHHLEHYAGRLLDDNKILSEKQLLDQLGVFLGRTVLGEEIFQRLYDGIQQRTLLIRLPATADDRLAAAFARIPWEIARSDIGQEPLLKRNVAIRAITGTDLPQDKEISLALESNEVLRVLLIFAETENSNPLATRLERQQLLDLFYDQILPKRLVQIDTLCYGVTRATIANQVRKVKGYHIVHWSGHGNHDSLLLSGEEKNQISGAGLVELFQQAGGFVPKLVFLSACHSGAFLSAAQEDLPGFENLAGLNKDLPDSIANKQGYTSTALALLMAGVPQVVAMRYSVDDTYARQLAVLFYQHLLAEQYNADAALATARTQLAANPNIAAIEHTTPLLFGQDRWVLEAVKKRNAAQLKQRYPERRFQPLLSDEQYGFKARTHFVGRSRELTRLNQDWLEANESPVALIQGLAGLGKTALAAEVVNLWHSRFDLVLVVQSRGYAMNAEAFYQQMDSLLVRLSKDYRQECQEDEYRKILLPKDEPARYESMRENLLAVLESYPILLLIDNFETNLLAEKAGYVCKDPEWTELLTAFVTRLQGQSRVIMTSRHRPNFSYNPDLTGFQNLSGLNTKGSGSDLTGFQNLSGLNREKGVVWLSLGPLPNNEAWLYLQSHEALKQLWYSDDKHLVYQVLKISHGHPLIMQRLGDLAHDKDALVAALSRLAEKGFKQLPDLVSGSDAQQEQERRYLEDVAIGAVDVLLERLSLEGRQLLWMVTRALEPVPLLVLAKVWENTAENVIAIGPLLKRELTESGLLQQEGERFESVFSFHELVRERCTAWMEQHPEDCGERDAKQIGQAYGEQYASLFKELVGSDKETATEMGRRAITYLVRAEAFEALGGFASNVVINTKNPQQLQAIIAELETVVEQVPAGRTRWYIRTSLADALGRSGQPQLALPFYAVSASEAEAAQNWADVAWSCQSWANALRDVGQLQLARETFQRAAQAYRKANSAKVDIMGSEIEALRIDIMLGEVETALPAIEQRLAQIRDWWQRHQQGETLTAATDADFLARVFIGALDIAQSAHHALKHWQDCLDLLTETEKVDQACGESEHVLAMSRFNRHTALIELGRLDEAQRVLEGCLQVDTNVGDLAGQAQDLYALADVWDERGDVSRAIELQRQALAICERLPNPEDRAISHGNLSTYLHKVGQIEEGARHRLVQIVYYIVIGNQQKLFGGECLGNLAILLQEAKEKGTTYPLPRFNELLQLAEFSGLRRWLEERGVDVGELQGRVDEVLKP
ncbi:CHAT domain-containing protein [Candidatus Parabeggiatoa sp. HSG14]|uniref:CHAT domain-containing protein n=1 Tax=Candidatus Parabeggiatoa sp. HSG14 TaxID=3055593 RepID=UPI0025A6CBBA|nr:CHAT domain-containing protein [Thiotrichales bacterium HSG14]